MPEPHPTTRQGLSTLLLSRRTITDTGCWEYTMKANRFGYKLIRVDQKLYLVHRLSWWVFRGRIPAGMFVLHTCDNPPCFNPDHLWLGTKQDNINDCYAKGRRRRTT